MKLYKNLVNSVALTLQEVFTKNRYADKALEKVFKEHVQWGSRDRRFVAEAVYDIVRNYRLYAQLAESEKNFWFITAVWLVLKNQESPDWQEFKHVDVNYILQQNEILKSSLQTAGKHG
jgi:16S rRNA (cytosine967-C5)-methyltransferase